MADITAFGAKPDTVSTQAIQDALDSGASEVFIPDGRYIMSAVKITAPVRLFGPGTIVVEDNTKAKVIFDVRARNVRFEGFRIDGNKAHQNAADQIIVLADRDRFSAVDMQIVGCRDKIFKTGLNSEGHVYERLALDGNGDIRDCNAFSFRGRGHKASKISVRNHGKGHAFRFGRFGVDPNDPHFPVEAITVSDVLVEDTNHNAFTFELGAED
jgi:hypothetical protein